jgi:hypothetical protein
VDQKEDVVERDGNGNYVVNSPASNVRPGHGIRSEIDDEIGMCIIWMGWRSLG